MGLLGENAVSMPQFTVQPKRSKSNASAATPTNAGSGWNTAPVTAPKNPQLVGGPTTTTPGTMGGFVSSGPAHNPFMGAPTAAPSYGFGGLGRPMNPFTIQYPQQVQPLSGFQFGSPYGVSPAVQGNPFIGGGPSLGGQVQLPQNAQTNSILQQMRNMTAGMSGREGMMSSGPVQGGGMPGMMGMGGGLPARQADNRFGINYPGLNPFLSR